MQQIFFERCTLLEKNGQFAFLGPFGGLEATYTVHLRLIGKLIVDFLLVIIELFSLGVRAEVLRANIDCKLPFFEAVVSLWPKISGRRRHPPATILRVGKVDEFPFHMV